VPWRGIAATESSAPRRVRPPDGAPAHSAIQKRVCPTWTPALNGAVEILVERLSEDAACAAGAYALLRRRVCQDPPGEKAKPASKFETT